MSKKKVTKVTEERWEGDGRSPAQQLPPAEAYAEGVARGGLLVLLALEVLVLTCLTALTFTDHLSGDQLVSSLKWVIVLMVITICVFDSGVRGLARRTLDRLTRRLR